jgi:diaminopropionate ammonia-lyase
VNTDSRTSLGGRPPPTLPTPWFARPAARDWWCHRAAADVQTFHHELPGYAPTPLVELPDLARELGVGRVFVKDESARFGLGAFKFLGASWATARAIAGRAGLPAPISLAAVRDAVATDPPVLVTATDGNHGRAVARMARLLGVPARVVVPDVVPAAAVERIAAEGAVVTTVAGTYDDAVAEAASQADGRAGGLLVQDTAWPGYETVPQWIVDGYSTLTREADTQLADAGAGRPDLVVVPVGVGSLAQAVVTHYRSVDRPDGGSAGREGRPPRPAVLAVEPDTAACVLASLHGGAAGVGADGRHGDGRVELRHAVEPGLAGSDGRPRCRGRRDRRRRRQCRA